MNEAQKQARIARAEGHIEQDRLIHGYYTLFVAEEHHKGCSVGCDAIDIGSEQHGNMFKYLNATDNNYHKTVADHDGTPVWLEWLRDVIYEDLPEEHSEGWHVDLAKALPVIDDWEPLRHCLAGNLIAMFNEHRDACVEGLKDALAVALQRAAEHHSGNGSVNVNDLYRQLLAIQEKAGAHKESANTTEEDDAADRTSAIAAGVMHLLEGPKDKWFPEVMNKICLLGPYNAIGFGEAALRIAKETIEACNAISEEMSNEAR